MLEFVFGTLINFSPIDLKPNDHYKFDFYGCKPFGVVVGYDLLLQPPDLPPKLKNYKVMISCEGYPIVLDIPSQSPRMDSCNTTPNSSFCQNQIDSLRKHSSEYLKQRLNK